VAQPSKRIADFGETVFSAYARRAREAGALDLGQGFPIDGPPEFVREALREASHEPQQYAPLPGHPALLEQIVLDHSRWLGRPIAAPENVLVTTGATEALFASVQAFIDPGDEVIIFEPFYDAYPADVRMAGGVVRTVPLEPDASGRWTFDPDALRRVVTPRTKAIMLTTPHNPTGTVFRAEELDVLVEVAGSADALLISDEVYEHLAFPGHTRLATRPGAWERTLTISSFGKSFSATGWKLGWVIGPEAHVTAVRKAHQWIPYVVATPLQVAAAKSLAQARENDDAYYRALRSDYELRATTLVNALQATPLEASMPEGGYFVMVDISALGYCDDVEAAQDLPQRVAVGAIPPSAFYLPENKHRAKHWLRLAFCKPISDLEEAGRRLATL